MKFDDVVVEHEERTAVQTAGNAIKRPARGHMQADQVVKNFGGVSVLRGISVDFVGPGVHVVIGANGAGKSTFFGVLTGRHVATSGRMLLDGHDISHAATFQRARLGLGIKMQVPSLFPGLTVLENLQLAGHASRAESPSKHVNHVIASVGLHRKMNVPVSSLAHGEQQWLEIAIVLAQNPSVILLDEPAAGMTSDERQRTVQLIHMLSQDHSNRSIAHTLT